MKKILFASAIALACGLAQAQAAEPFYIGGAFGQAKVSVDVPGVDESDTGFKIYGGYQVTPMFGAEIGYIDFGQATAAGGSIEVGGLYAAAVGRLEFTKEFAGVGRLGLARVTTDITGFGSESKIKLYYGLGLEYGFTKNLKGVAALDFSQGEHSGDEGDVHLMSIGVQYSF